MRSSIVSIFFDEILSCHMCSVHMVSVTIVADDFGYCERRDQGILELIESGIVTKTSLLINAVETENAVNKFCSRFSSKCAELHLGLGLHLNLTEGKPISEPRDVPSLVNNNNGHMLGKFGLREKISRGDVLQEDIKSEIESQIKKFEHLLGFLPDYVDGHQHVHVLPCVRPVFASVLKQYGIQKTRLPLQIDIDQCSWLDSSQIKFFKQVCVDSANSVQIFQDSGIKHSDFFIGLSTSGKYMQRCKILTGLQCVMSEIKLKRSPDREAAQIEFMVHPGYKSSPGEGGCGDGPDEFSLSTERELEMEFLYTDLSSLMKELNLQIIKF